MRQFGFLTYQMERHIRKEKDIRVSRLTKDLSLDPEFKALWDRIKPKTTYRIEFSTEELVRSALAELKRMEKIEPLKISLKTGAVAVTKAGVETRAVSMAEERGSYDSHPIPDLLAYLQDQTELTRSTLVNILKKSRRLDEFFNDPQRFLDRVAGIINNALNRMIVDGIKYERITGAGPDVEWEMMRFKNEELINYLNALPVKKSVYDYVVYDSEVEREFAEKLDQRDDIKLFVKLPNWFKIETPVGEYNPDWAIVKHNDETVYMVRETKGTKDFMQLRNSERDKVFCGQRHFEALNVSFKVVTSADDV